MPTPAHRLAANVARKLRVSGSTVATGNTSMEETRSTPTTLLAIAIETAAVTTVAMLSARTGTPETLATSSSYATANRAVRNRTVNESTATATPDTSHRSASPTVRTEPKR